MLGGYSGVPLSASTVLQGIRDTLPPGVEVLYHEGCKITIGGLWGQDEVTASDPDEDRASIRQAAAIPRAPTSSFWRLMTTSRPRARPGRGTTWATAPASTWLAGRTS
jgi:hypothetical protein